MTANVAMPLWEPSEPSEQWPETPAYARATFAQLSIETEAFAQAALMLGYRAQTGVDTTTLDRYLIKELRHGGQPQQTAMDIAQYLMRHKSYAWWGTPLGRACAWHIGYEAEYPPTEAITAILGFSRQQLMKVRNKRELNGLPRELTALDVQHMLQQRWAAQRAGRNALLNEEGK